MTELTCPTCHTALRVARHPAGAIWVCEKCAGAAASLAVLRKRLKTGLAADFWRKVLDGSVASQRPCPLCGQSMRGFAMPLEGHTNNLDLCKSCQFVWFDGGELESLPKGVSKEEDAGPKRDLGPGPCPEVEKVENCAYTGWLVIDLLLDFFAKP